MRDQDVFTDIKFGWKDRTENLVGLDRRLQELMAEAPSDASATLLIVSTNHRYRSMIGIESSQQRMAVSCEGNEFGEMLECLFKKMRTQIVSGYDRRRTMT